MSKMLLTLVIILSMSIVYMAHKFSLHSSHPPQAIQVAPNGDVQFYTPGDLQLPGNSYFHFDRQERKDVQD